MVAISLQRARLLIVARFLLPSLDYNRPAIMRAAWAQTRASMAYLASQRPERRRVTTLRAEFATRRVDRRLSEAGTTLAAMKPTTPAGVIAKARGCLAALGSFDDSTPPDWLDDMMRATLVAVVTVGGAS